MWDPSTRYGRGVLLRKLGLPPDASDSALDAALRGFQRARGLAPTGVPDGPSVSLLGPAADEGLLPAWWAPGMGREDVAARADLDEAGLRRLEGQWGHPPGSLGVEELARLVDQHA